jgi:hypothetical protein
MKLTWYFLIPSMAYPRYRGETESEPGYFV